MEAAPQGRVRAEEVLKILEECFSPDEAALQLETATDWGRYAELFSFDENEGVFHPDVHG